MSKVDSSLVKSNALINATYKLSVVEQRVLILALMNAQDGIVTDHMLYRVKAADLQKYTGMTFEWCVESLRLAVNKLQSREISFYEKIDDTNIRLVRANWVQTVCYEEENNAVLLRFNHNILPYLNKLVRRFSVLYIANGDNAFSLYFSSAYSYRLLEMLTQHISEKSFEATPDELRKAFSIYNQYDKISEFRRRVLDVAVREINDKSPWRVTYEAVKSGVKIVMFKFRFTVPSSVLGATERSRFGITNADICRHAKPGETYEQTRDRLITIKQDIERTKQGLFQ